MTFQQCNAVLTCDQTSYCGLVNLTGTVNTTEIKRTGADQMLYAWRITIENCSDYPLCNVFMNLNLDWKISSAELSGTIYQQPVGFPGIVNMFTVPENLPGFVFNPTWDGNTIINLSTGSFDLPRGKSIIEVYAEAPIDALDQGRDCYLPALFPAIVDLAFRSQKGTICPAFVATFIGCSPKCVTVDPEIPPP